MSDGNRARVFISCGQAKGSIEEVTANQIAERLRLLGFDPYIAVAEQTLRGLKENIFGRLRTSEYFVFVDFKREKLENKPIHRGSLFSNQELAIASFMDIEVLCLQEDGVKPDDGIFRYLQANAIPFKDKHTLANVIADKVQERGWNPNWRNELTLERLPDQVSEAFNPQIKKTGSYFHVNVCNHHREKMATNCIVHLEKAKRLSPSAIEIPLKTVEFKWAGTPIPYVGISPGTKRPFDAFHIFHDLPSVLQFNIFSDSSEFYPRISGEGIYELTYLVSADNFPACRGTFKLDLKNLLAQTKFI